ncbi:MBL fold metallo-hydrolase [Parablautia intestinalis]|uniref:MBL fold metallo-hydrolase n=1 Tax=Parablautia intestinalis TaxID=2320100 RepID=A0A3A9A9J2_9FIRM|nr:MBL fold metallo-hydrolase [Parablautia intestinalis]RKI88047.1 MBL fold metallo-hydrolase [Parablautia intestinalis]
MADLKIGRIMLGICQTNCYFVYREGSSQALVFDPADKGDYIYNGLKEKGFTVAAILLTHGHFDHIWGVEALKELSGVKVYAYEEEREVCENASVNVSKGAGRPCIVQADTYLKDGEERTIEGISFKLLATPGHTKGSCCYYFEDDKILISGDTLFQESVGRTDLPTGSMSTLVRSVKGKLMPLPEDVRVYPGHGEATTIGYEKQYNPFI